MKNTISWKNKFLTSRMLILIVILFAVACNSDKQLPDYKNSEKSVDARVADLLGRMTLEEKVAQTLSIWKGKNEFMTPEGDFLEEKAQEILKNGIGHIARPGEVNVEGKPNLSPLKQVKFANAIQKHLIEKTRLGIPAIFHEEALHGQQAPGATSFPQAIALSGTWDTELITEVFSSIAKEIRVRGSHQVLTPVLDVARDPRWGRIEETYGEDPYLISQIAKASVLGFQGESEVIDSNHVAATLKHFVAHGQPENGTNCGPANYSEDYLTEVLMKPFEDVIKQTNVWSIMVSYNEIAGIPLNANKYLLTDLLRDQWGFKGVVVSDYESIQQLEMLHHVSNSKEESAKLAIEAGVDIELPDMYCYPELVELVRSGKVSEKILDRSVERILRMKFMLGLFDDPFAGIGNVQEVVHSQKHQDLAYKTGSKAITLLKNEENLLPLNENKIKTLGIIGPNAKGIHLGGYSNEPREGIDIYTGMEEFAKGKFQIKYAEGCRITEGYASWFANDVVYPDPKEEDKRIIEAVKVAKQCDVVILCVGENEQITREAWSVYHLGDRDELNLFGKQDALAKAIVETGVPVVVVLTHGKPIAINYIAKNVPAIIDAWYLGEKTGKVVADALFGKINPGGKLPITYPRSVGQIPVYYSHKPSARRGYLNGDITPLFSFGFGLSYTTFEYSNLKITPDSNILGKKAILRVDVKNKGKIKGDEIVQLYIHDKIATRTRPVKELKGFERITLKAGETKTVEFEIGFEDLKLYNQYKKWVVEPGEFDIMVGSSSDNLDTVLYTIIDK